MKRLRFKSRSQKNSIRFFVNGSKTVERKYTFENCTIISEEKPISKTRDSLHMLDINPDTIVIEIKEKGLHRARKFVRVE